MSQKFDFEVFSEMNAALESASFGEVIISISLFIVLLCHILVEKLSYVHPRTIVCPQKQSYVHKNNRMSTKTQSYVHKNNRMSFKTIQENNRMS